MEWDNYIWPEWVPSDIRSQIMKFWGKESFGRTCQDWLNDSECRSGAPKIGDLVDCEKLLSSKERMIGRWVHAWNNIGRVVFDDGSFGYTSTCGIKILNDNKDKKRLA